MVAPFIWAEEEEIYPEGTEGPAEEQVVQEESQDPPAEEDGGDSTIETGDADSLADVDTTANTNVDCVEGEITAPEDPCVPPEGETECTEDVVISNDNLADVADEASSAATTGDNSIEDTEGDALIDTGDATAGASLENTVNTNVVLFEEGEGNEVDELGEEEELAGESCDGEDGPEIIIKNENEGDLTNDADVLADTGENQANENEGDATIDTGDALAWANLVNLLNTNVVGSNFEILILDFLQGENGEINLNEIWKLILGKEGVDSLVLVDESDLANLQLLILNQNQANLENDVEVGALTGENQANENNNAVISTGDAIALANLANLVNLNILGSKFFLVFINILGDFEDDLILPRPENFTVIDQEGNPQDPAFTPVIFANQNEATLDDQVLATAETGTNEEINNQGDNLIETGDAQAVANTISLINLNIFRNSWFFFIINCLGNWTGQILGWSTPGGADQPTEGSQVYQLGMDGTAPEGEALDGGGFPYSIFQNQNQATVSSNINTWASTGENQANENEGNASIFTGNAWSLANLFNLINLNILGGRWFFGLINILGNWTGNAIFAYPDVVVSLTNGMKQVMVGETTHYTLSFQNQGYDEASNVWVGFELPQGTSFLGDSSGLTPTVSGNNYSWFIGSLKVGEEGSFTIQVRINPDFSFEEPLSFWSKIIPQAHAAENGKESEVVANASIGTADPESDLSNNQASAKTLVYLPEEEGVGQGQPILEVSAKNNVGEYIYSGDTVTFEIYVSNTGGSPSHDTYLLQTLYNGVPADFGVAEFEIGTVEPGKVAKLSFGLQLADNGLLPAGHYYTIAQAFGKAPDGEEAVSNQARTDFELRVKEIASLFEARALEEEKGEILGTCQPTEEILPYVLLFLLSSFYLLDKSKKLSKIKAQQ